MVDNGFDRVVLPRAGDRRRSRSGRGWRVIHVWIESGLDGYIIARSIHTDEARGFSFREWAAMELEPPKFSEE